MAEDSHPQDKPPDPPKKMCKELVMAKSGQQCAVLNKDKPNINLDSEVIDALAMKSSLAVKLLGSYAPFHVMEKRLQDLWILVVEIAVMDLPNGYFIIQFETKDDYLHALIPWMLFGHYLITKDWSTTFNPGYKRHLYIRKVFSIAKSIGKPRKMDTKTLFVNKGRFARVCIEVELLKPLKDAY
ncbi:LOW QUALITY PROTEIN: hypothetical protein V2J09_021429 [Rumex salicifolius]